MLLLRSPDAAQRAVLHGVVRCRAGAVTNAGVWCDPGSAKQREERCIAPGKRGSNSVRSPDAAQRAVLHGVVRCRAGAVTNAGVWCDPGSAKQREERCIAPG